MNTVQEGDIILTDIPQANGQIKSRPALVLRQILPFNDFLLYGISSQLRHAVPNLDIIIDKTHPDFQHSGLTVPSLVRVTFLTVKPLNTIAGAIGYISHSTHQQLLKNLSDYLTRQGAFKP